MGDFQIRVFPLSKIHTRRAEFSPRATVPRSPTCTRLKGTVAATRSFVATSWHVGSAERRLRYSVHASRELDARASPLNSKTSRGCCRDGGHWGFGTAVLAARAPRLGLPPPHIESASRRHSGPFQETLTEFPSWRSFYRCHVSVFGRRYDCSRAWPCPS